jgi:hypothetical protein
MFIGSNLTAHSLLILPRAFTNFNIEIRVLFSQMQSSRAMNFLSVYLGVGL